MIHPILYFLGFLFLIGGVGTYFANKKSSKDQISQNWLKYFVYLLITLLTIFSVIFNFFTTLAVVISFTGLTELINIVIKDKKKPFKGLVIIGIYIIVSVFFVLFSYNFSGQQILFIYLIVASFDGFSQISGQLAGRRKLIPKISPGKTIEGLIGGAFSALLIAVFVKDWIGVSLSISLVSGLGIILFAFGGDIFASMIKRKYGVKNFSKIIPGHGGVLDRYDSFMLAGAMCYICLTFYNKFIIG